MPPLYVTVGSGQSTTINWWNNSSGDRHLTVQSGGTLVKSTLTGGPPTTSQYPGGPIGADSVDFQSGAVGSTISAWQYTTATVHSGATVNGLAAEGPGAQAIVYGVVSNLRVVSGGGTTLHTDGYATGTVMSGGTVVGLDMNFGTTDTIRPHLTLQNGGSVIMGPSVGGEIDMTGNTNQGLTISGLTSGGSVTTIISGFGKGTMTSNGSQWVGPTDGIVLDGIKAGDIKKVSYPDANHVTLTLQNGNTVTMNIPGVQGLGYQLVPSADGSIIFEACFLEGTSLLTSEGYQPIETLKAGQTLAVLNGEEASYRPIVWSGSRHVEVKQDPELKEDEAGWPICIRAHAIHDNVPRCDLWVTPEHCLFLNGKFIPARMLVNGRSIFYDRTKPSYTYWHVELDEHAIIAAEGVLSESYLDTGNRTQFETKVEIRVTDEGNALLTPARARAPKTWDEAAAPLDTSRAFAEPLWHALNERATQAGLPPAPTSSAHA